MSSKDFCAKTYLTCLAPHLNISIQESWKPTVELHIANAAKMMQQLENVPLEENHCAPANVFVAIEPEASRENATLTSTQYND